MESKTVDEHSFSSPIGRDDVDTADNVDMIDDVDTSALFHALATKVLTGNGVEFDNPLQEQVSRTITSTTTRLFFLNIITAHVCELIRGHKLSPKEFELDMDSFYDYLELDEPTGNLHSSYLNPEVQWNGVAFICNKSGVEYRVATTVGVNKDGAVTEFTLDLLRLKYGADSWELWVDDRWIEGPPEDWFDGDDEDIDWLDDEDWDDAADNDEFFLAMRVQDALPITPAVAGKLINSGIRTIGDLVDRTEDDLLQINGIGIATVHRISDYLDSLGFELKDY